MTQKDQVEESLADRACTFAYRKHGQQTRRGGEPYTCHLDRVVNRLAMESERARAAGWLHDVVEDTETTFSELDEAGFPAEVVQAVLLLTRSDGETYELYLSRIKTCSIARKVKIADMLDNLTDRPTEHQVKRYCRGILFLME